MNPNVQITVLLKDAVTQDLKKISDSFKSVETNLKSHEQAFKDMAKVGTAGLAAIGVGTVMTTNSFAAFEKEIQKTGANVNATSEQLEMFRQVAIQASKDTGRSATEMANALFWLAGGSIGAEEAAAILDETIKFATINQLSLEQAARQSAAAITLFGLDAEDTSQVLDILTRSGQISFATMEEMSGAFIKAAPVASQLGVSIVDLTAMIGSMAEAGFQGEQAGTALDRMFQELVNPTKQMTEGLAELGLNAQVLQRTLAQDGIIAVLRLLENAVADIHDPIQRASALSRAFGEISGRGIAGMLQVGTDAIVEMREELENSSGALEESFRRINEAEAPYSMLSNQISLLSLQIGKALTPAFRELTGAISPIISAMAGWIEAHPRLFAGLVAVTAVAFGLIAGLGFLGMAFIGVVGAAVGLVATFAALGALFAGLGTVAAIAFNPIILSIIATILIVKALYNNWEVISGYLQSIWIGLSAAATAIFTALAGFFSGMWSTIAAVATSVWEGIQGGLAAGWEAISAMFNTFMEPLSATWTSFWEAMGEIVSGVWEGIKKGVTESINFIIKGINKVIEGINKIANAGAGKLGFDIPNLPKIPMLATGGIVTSPTLAMIGEVGLEAVVPLSRYNSARGFVGAGAGGGASINITISGNQFMDDKDLMRKVGDQMTRYMKNNYRV